MKKKTHALAIYGTTRYKTLQQVSYKQRFWKKRSDGIKQRYRKSVTKTVSKFKKGGERITLFGNLKDIAKAEKKIEREKWIPKKKFQDRVNAKDFLENPEKYARKGDWVDREKKKSP